ncbi:MAG: relaxase/mobilization nuclease domain-containing protein [Sphingobacteriales bacterium]
MIGKIVIGKSFAGCIRYAVSKKDAVILAADGIRTDQLSHTIADFDMQRKSNPGLGMAVAHIALSWSSNDLSMLSDEKMVQMAEEYMQRMKIFNTQYLIVRHHDSNNPHLHLIYNRVDNEGKTITDNFMKSRNVKVCRELTEKHGFFISAGKKTVNEKRLKGADKLKYELYHTIKATSSTVKSMDELQKDLAKQGIMLHYKYKSGTSEIQGISFSKGEYKFKGSEIDRSLSFANLSKAIEIQANEFREPVINAQGPEENLWYAEDWSDPEDDGEGDDNDNDEPLNERQPAETYKPSLADQLRMAVQGISITPEPEPKKKKKRQQYYGR